MLLRVAPLHSVTSSCHVHPKRATGCPFVTALSSTQAIFEHILRPNPTLGERLC